MANITKKAENIKLLCSITEQEESSFTEHQLDLVNSLRSGLSIPEIAHKWGCGPVNIYNRISCCAEKLKKLRLLSSNGFGMPQDIRVLCSMLRSITEQEESSFTEHQLDLVNSLRSGLSIPEIAREWGCKSTTVYLQIYSSAKKLEKLRLPSVNDPSSTGGIHKKASFLCSMAKPEEPSFTEHQLDLVNSLRSGLSFSGIAHKWGCGASAVYSQISYCAKKLEKLRLSPDIESCSTDNARVYYSAKKLENAKLSPDARGKRGKINYHVYSGLDFSVLDTRERECLQSRIDYPDLSNKELAEMHNISYSKYSYALFNAVNKLDGKGDYHKSYQQTHRESVNAASKRYKDKHKDKQKEYRKQWWEKNREDKLPSRRKYNKEYYQKNRDTILAARKKRKEITDGHD